MEPSENFRLYFNAQFGWWQNIRINDLGCLDSDGHNQFSQRVKNEWMAEQHLMIINRQRGNETITDKSKLTNCLDEQRHNLSLLCSRPPLQPFLIQTSDIQSSPILSSYSVLKIGAYFKFVFVLAWFASFQINLILAPYLTPAGDTSHPPLPFKWHEEARNGPDWRISKEKICNDQGCSPSLNKKLYYVSFIYTTTLWEF